LVIGSLGLAVQTKSIKPPWPGVGHRPGQAADRHQQQPGDSPEGATLVPEVHGLLQVLRIERPPLCAAHAATIRQCRWPA
jgi:hypothetical protein